MISAWGNELLWSLVVQWQIVALGILWAHLTKSHPYLKDRCVQCNPFSLGSYTRNNRGGCFLSRTWHCTTIMEDVEIPQVPLYESKSEEGSRSNTDTASLTYAPLNILAGRSYGERKRWEGGKQEGMLVYWKALGSAGISNLYVERPNSFKSLVLIRH